MQQPTKLASQGMCEAQHEHKTIVSVVTSWALRKDLYCKDARLNAITAGVVAAIAGLRHNRLRTAAIDHVSHVTVEGDQKPKSP